MSIMDMLKGLANGLINGETNQFAAKQMMEVAAHTLSFNENFDAPIVQGILNITAPLGFLMAVTYFLFGYMKSALRDKEADVDLIVKSVIFFLLADIALQNLGTIIGNVMGVSGSFATQMQTSIEAIQYDAWKNTQTGINWDGASLLALLFTGLLGLLGILLSWLMSIVIIIICLSAKIDILLRLSFLPIGISPIADPDGQHEGIRYLKKTIASALYCGAILAGIYIAMMANFGSIQNTVVDTAKTSGLGIIGEVLMALEMTILTQVVAPFAAVGAINTAKGMINEALGA